MKAPGVFYYKGKKIVKRSRKVTFTTIHGYKNSWIFCKELDWYVDDIEEFKEYIHGALYSKYWDERDRKKVRKYYR